MKFIKRIGESIAFGCGGAFIGGLLSGFDGLAMAVFGIILAGLWFARAPQPDVSKPNHQNPV